MSAYALNRAVGAHVPLYRSLKQGNVYHLIQKLAGEGLLLRTRARSERGPRPFKNVFRLSASGERRFHTLLGGILNDLHAPDPAVEIAYVLLGQLPRDKARAFIGSRLKEVRAQQKRLARLYGSGEGRSGGGELAFRHTVARLREEEQFLRDSLRLFDNKKWHAGWSQ